MSNTYFEKGSTKKEDILNDFSGYYLKKTIGGQVDPSVGTFTFGVGMVYEYKKGKIINRYKQASISGTIKNYLENIIEVSNNKKISLTTGFCGKDGQSVPVSDGGPLLKLKKTTVGGTKHE
jgi:TldD protein